MTIETIKTTGNDKKQYNKVKFTNEKLIAKVNEFDGDFQEIVTAIGASKVAIQTRLFKLAVKGKIDAGRIKNVDDAKTPSSRTTTNQRGTYIPLGLSVERYPLGTDWDIVVDDTGIHLMPVAA